AVPFRYAAKVLLPVPTSAVSEAAAAPNSGAVPAFTRSCVVRAAMLYLVLSEEAPIGVDVDSKHRTDDVDTGVAVAAPVLMDASHESLAVVEPKVGLVEDGLADTPRTGRLQEGVQLILRVTGISPLDDDVEVKPPHVVAPRHRPVELRVVNVDADGGGLDEVRDVREHVDLLGGHVRLDCVHEGLLDFRE